MAKYITITYFISSVFTLHNAQIVVGPQDTEAEMGKTIEFYCKGTLDNVEWQHLAMGEQYTKLVYKDGFFYDGFKERFSISKTNDGRTVLNIRGVKASDAGKFICLENSETPSQRAAELIVFERFPSNESCAGRYTCKPVCNELELSCEMKAHGNHIPSMQWIDSEGEQSSSVQVVSNETTLSRVTLKVDPYVAVSFTCLLKYQEIPLKSKYIWTYSTSVIKEVESLEESHFVSVAVAVITTSLVAALIGITCFVIYRKRKIKWKDKNKPERYTSVEQCEKNRDDAQRLISMSIDIGGNSVKDKVLPRKTVNKGSPIFGPEAIDDEVFVITREERVVKVSHLNKDTLKRCWSFGGLINPDGMASCPTGNKIVICFERPINMSAGSIGAPAAHIPHF